MKPSDHVFFHCTWYTIACFPGLVELQILKQSSPAFIYDPVLELAENCMIRQGENSLDFLLDRTFSDAQMESACLAFKDRGIIGVADSYFKNKVVNNFVDISVERKLYMMDSRTSFTQFARRN